MLDLGYVRANLALVKERLSRRGPAAAIALTNFEEYDERRKIAISQAEGLQARRNQVSAQVASAKQRGDEVSALVEENRVLRAEFEKLQSHAKLEQDLMGTMLVVVPNLPHESVPAGQSEQDNVEQRRWGAPRKFAFEAKPHWELGEALGILDMDRAAKISGARFAVYWREGAQLERALASFMLDQHTRHHGYTEVLPPVMVNEASLFGTGQLPKFREDLFKTEGDHWLIPTAEVPLTNLYRDETLDELQLPISLTASTACFRAEAGSYGKDTRGVIRQHQFQKVELVKFARPDTSYEEHEKLTRDAETILELLELPYRRMLLCAGDMGFAAAKTYDLEVWLPGQNTYREISSCSNFEAFQARRANIKFKPRAGGKSEFVHTLNGSGLAIGRTWLAILENYQQADGSVEIPKVLVPYMGGKTAIEMPKERRG